MRTQHSVKYRINLRIIRTKSEFSSRSEWQFPVSSRWRELRNYTGGCNIEQLSISGVSRCANFFQITDLLSKVDIQNNIQIFRILYRIRISWKTYLNRFFSIWWQGSNGSSSIWNIGQKTVQTNQIR